MQEPEQYIPEANPLLISPPNLNLQDQLTLAEIELLQHDIVMIRPGPKTPEQIENHEFLQENVHDAKLAILENAREQLTAAERSLDGTSQESMQNYIDALREASAAESSIETLDNAKASSDLLASAQRMEDLLRDGLESGEIVSTEPNLTAEQVYANLNDIGPLMEQEGIKPDHVVYTYAQLQIEASIVEEAQVAMLREEASQMEANGNLEGAAARLEEAHILEAEVIERRMRAEDKLQTLSAESIAELEQQYSPNESLSLIQADLDALNVATNLTAPNVEEHVQTAESLQNEMDAALTEYLEQNPELLNLPPEELSAHLEEFLEQFNPETQQMTQEEILLTQIETLGQQALEQGESIAEIEQQIADAENQIDYQAPSEYLRAIEDGHIQAVTRESNFTIGEVSTMSSSFATAANGDSFDAPDVAGPGPDMGYYQNTNGMTLG